MELLRHQKNHQLERFFVDKDGNVDYKKLNEIFFQQPEKIPLQLKRRKEIKAILYNSVISRAILHSEISSVCDGSPMIVTSENRLQVGSATGLTLENCDSEPAT